MASNNDPRSVNATLSGTTVDTVLLTNFWDTITVRNNDTTNTCYVRFDGTDPAAGQEGAFIVAPASSRTFGPSAGIKNSAGVPGSTTAATACHFCKIIGNGGSYGFDGGASSASPGAGGSGLSSAGSSNGVWTLTDGTASHGKIVLTVTTVASVGAQSMSFFANANDSQPTLNFGSSLFGVALQTGVGGSTAPGAIELIKTISTSTTNAGTTDGTEADLYTDTLVASRLGADGDMVEVSYAGTVINTGGTTKRVRVYFGGTVVWDTTATAIAAAGQWSVNVKAIRVSASAVDIIAVGGWTGPATPAYIPQLVSTVTGLTLANTQIFKVTGQSAGGSPAANDVVATSKRMWYVPV